MYDILGRLTSKSCSDGTRISYAFDKYNKGTKTNYRINGINRSVSYTYNENKDNALDKTTFANSAQYQYVYNDYGQVTSANLTREALAWRNMYGYIDPGSNRYSNVISTLYFPDYETDGRRLRYRYDTKGNIAQIADGNGSSTFENADKVVTYTYDQLNQLKTEVNGYTGETVNYTYDSRGNILSKEITVNGVTDTVNYTYGDSNWKDKLTAYNGCTITYDEIGNPLTYDGWNYTWQKGRQLESMENSDTSLSFTYNNDGIRTGKTVDGVTTEYYLDGTTIIAQKTGDQMLRFHYDGNGTRVYMEVRNETTGSTQGYYYVYNSQGDVIALYDNTGSVISEYTYDSWGKVVDVSGSNTVIGNLNPFRYRGYYYDSETGLYYLKNRYYNPEIGRFINADGELAGIGGSILGNNVFQYCFNNPVNLGDPYGQWPQWAKKVGNAIKKVASGVANFFNPNTFTLGGSFQEGLFRGSGSVTGGYSEFNWRLQDNIKSSGSQDGWLGGFGKVSVGNANGRAGIGDDNASASLKGVVDVLTATAQVGLHYKDGFGVGAKLKAAVATGRVTTEFNVFGWEVELGLSGDLLSLGAEATVGVFPEEGFKVHTSVGAGLFGGGFLFRVKAPN